jgi:tellurium resistance protein TerZ
MAISLSKGQTISLEKQAPGLTKVRMGLGWDAAKPKGLLSSMFGGGGGSVDLDASCLLFDAQARVVDKVWFRQLRSQDGSVRHSGDNRTGEGDGDDETIAVDLAGLPANVKSLVFTVNSFLGQTFDKVDNASCRLVDEMTGKEIARFDLAEKGTHIGVVMAVLSRATGSWSMKAIGETADGRTVDDLVGRAASFV